MEHEQPKKKKMSALKKVVVSAVTVVLAGAICIGAYVCIQLWRMQQGSIGIVDPSEINDPGSTDLAPSTPQPIYKKDPLDQDVINILLAGSDAQKGEAHGRTDSMILLSYNKKANTAKLVSFMRDTWLEIPGHGEDRLNTASRFGGIGLTINVINDYYDLELPNYVIVRFEEFVEIVDKIGGIEIELDSSEIAFINKKAHNSDRLSSRAGTKTLNGEQSLWHCRNRTDRSGDFARTQRQRDVMFIIFNKLTKVRNPVTLMDILNFSAEHVETNIPVDQMLSIGMDALSSDLTLSETRVPFDGTYEITGHDGKKGVFDVDFEAATLMLHEFLYGSYTRMGY